MKSPAPCGITIEVGNPADFVLYGPAGASARHDFRLRKTVAELIYDPCHERTTYFNGRVVSR